MEEIIKNLSLSNGLTLNIYNESRKVAGDRWLVKCTAAIEVPVNRLKANKMNIDAEQAAAVLGETVLFKQKQERNFVDDNEYGPLLAEMVTSFTDSLKSYFEHPEFAQRFILKSYHEKSRQQMMRGA